MTISKDNLAKVKFSWPLLTGKEGAMIISFQKIPMKSESLKALNHPNIVKIFEVIKTKKTLLHEVC